MTGDALQARSAFAGHISTLADKGVIVEDRDGLGIASLSVRRGLRRVLEQRAADSLGVSLPDGPRRHVAGDLTVVGTGPGSWLLTQERAANRLSTRVKAAVGNAASVTDQSDAYALIRLTGPKLRELLARLVPIDVHARAFREGDVAATVLAHMGALLYRLPDGTDGQPVIEVAVYRSFAASLWHELVAHSL